MHLKVSTACGCRELIIDPINMNFHFSLRAFGKLLVAGCCVLFTADNLVRAAYTDPAIAVKVISSASSAHQPILTLRTNGLTMVTLVATASNFTPTNFIWSQVTDSINSFAAGGMVTFSGTQTTTNQVLATLPTAGVYQLAVTASDGVASASRFVWVQVWPAVGAAQPNVQIGRNPDITPPNSVRQFSADPGPFCHPRVLFSRADWQELHRKTTNSTEVRLAITNLETALAANFDKAGSQMRTNITIYTNYAAGGYSGAYFTNTVFPMRTNNLGIMSNLIIGHNPSGAYFDALVTACYLAWVGTDPTLPHGLVAATNQARFNYLATLVAATAKVEMNLNATLSGGVAGALASGTNMANAYDLALCYDFVYDWMTPPQQNDTRDYLYAIGYGYNNTGGGGISRNSVWSGHLQNGDFPNLADGIVLPQFAIEGEEPNVTASVQSAFGPTQPYATGPTAWAYASPAAVNNLRRLLNWNTDWFVTPWGFLMNMVDYFQLGQNISATAALAFARRGEDQFTTTCYYQSSLAALYNLAPGEDGKGMRLFDHHDGLPFTPGPRQMNAAYIMKYVYPDDPMVDFVYRAFRIENENDLVQAMFGSDPTNTPLAMVAQQKNLAWTKFDPERAVAVSRNGWGENDLNLVFENRFDQDGHMHAERNNFSLYALGRAWSSPPGYHCTINDLQATVLIQNPNFASDPATSGYIGQSPSSATITTNNSWGPPPPGQLLEITEDPAAQWTLFAGDASLAYNWGLGTNNSINTGVTQAQNAWPGLLSNLSAYTQSQLASTWSVQSTNYNTVQYALRSVLTVRGTNPYVLVLDDICKDGTPQNYRWSMPCAVSFGPSGGRFVDNNGSSVYSSLTNLSGATATDITLYHLIDKGTNSQKGLPRMLVRDVTEAAVASQPPIFVENHPSGLGATNLTYGWDNNSKVFSFVPSSRVLITRTNMVFPSFKILLYPFLSGSNLPTTSWNSNRTILTVDQMNGTVDAFVFDRSNPDHRTRITGFTRTRGHAPPTLSLPSNVVAVANTTAPNGQPGAVANFSVTATDYLGNTLAPLFSSPPGNILPVGVNLVQVSVVDSLGEQTSLSFPVTVIPSAPPLTVSVIRNLSSGGTNYGLTLSWPAFNGTTGYNVYRSTMSGGSYVLVSSNQKSTTYSDTNLTSTGYFYVVTGLLNSYEGPFSNEVALAPSSGGPFTNGYIGTAVGDGIFQSASNWVLTCSQGDIPGGNFSEQCTYLYQPWNGDGSFTVRLSGVNPAVGSLSQYSKFGVMLRASTVNNTTYAMSGWDPYVSPVYFQYRRTAGGVSGIQSLFNYSYAVYPPVWSRLVRSGTNFSAFYSYDGSSWNQIGMTTNVPIATNAIVGLAVAPQNTTAASAMFDNLVFLGTPKISATYNRAVMTWQGQAAAYSVQVATSQTGPFQTLASGLSTTNFTDLNIISGSTRYYTVSATGPLGGLTTSPVVAVTFPSPPPAPVISNGRISGGNVIFTGTNGYGTGNYLVLATTNLSLPLASWTILATNIFGSGGVISFNLSITNSPQMYYRLRLP